VLEIINLNRMLDDESILDALGVVAVVIGVAAIATGVINGGPILKLLESGSPLVLAGLAAIVGGGALKAYLKNR
jgi:hypothetical protein